MVERAELLVVGTGCGICHVVLCDESSIIASDHPFIMDVRMLKLARDGEWETVRLLVEDALQQWSDVAKEYQENYPELATTDILPFMLTTEGKYIAKEVYDRMETMKREAGR